MKEKQFIETLKNKNIVLNDQQIEQFDHYFELLIKWNEKVNLTRITNRDEVYLKHFYDSITPSFYSDFNKVTSVCDVGAGAGFPSIPLKICFPHLHVTIIDSLKKRINFLETLIDALHLKNISLVHGRAEDVGQDPKFRESFDLVTARAVARMSVLSELCLPFVRLNGHFIALKGSKADEELDQGLAALRRLGGQVVSNHSFLLPIEKSERSIIIIKKDKKTAKKFPRQAGTPQRKPLA